MAFKVLLVMALLNGAALAGPPINVGAISLRPRHPHHKNL
jgi:hypothetical protein